MPNNFDLMQNLRMPNAGSGLAGNPGLSGGMEMPGGMMGGTPPSPTMPNNAINTGARSPNMFQRIGRNYNDAFTTRQGFGNAMQGLSKMSQGMGQGMSQGQPPIGSGFQRAFMRASPMMNSPSPQPQTPQPMSNTTPSYGQPFQNRRTDFSQFGF